VLHTFTKEKVKIKNLFENTGPYISGDGGNKKMKVSLQGESS